MKKVVFGTVIYKQAEIFFDSFLKCVENQTVKDFDLLLINDNLDQEAIIVLEEKLHEYGFEDRYCIVQGKKRTGYLSDFRIQMIKEASGRNYELLVIGDIYDLFAQNRVEAVYSFYKKNEDAAFFFNSLIDENGKSVLRELPNKITDIDMISQGNFLGMSNTAINLGKVSIELVDSLYEGGCNIFDWYLYSRIILDGGIGILVEDTNTVYRIHDNNIAGIQGDSLEELERERMVKLSHYQRLIPFSKRFLNYEKQLEHIVIDKEFYNTKYYNKNGQGYWWNNIRLEEKDV